MTFGKPMRAIFLATAFAAASLPSVAAEGSRTLADALALEAPNWEFDNTTIRLGGFAAGALFTARQSAGPGYASGYHNTRASSEAGAKVPAQRIFDNGMGLGARGDFLLYYQKLFSANYDRATDASIYVFRR